MCAYTISFPSTEAFGPRPATWYSAPLVDPSKPGRELDHVFLSRGPELDAQSRSEADAFGHWFEYLWRERSRPATTDCVIFDLYDTLLTVPPEARRAIRSEMSRLSGVSEQDLERLWESTREESNRGELVSTTDRFKRILQMAAGKADDDLAGQLAALEHRLLRNQVEYRPSARETLTTLTARGYRLAILSNCSASAISSIVGSGITAYVSLFRLSFELGKLKPDPTLYQELATAAGSEPSRCVFVGDGANNELAGAQMAGLKTVLTLI